MKIARSAHTLHDRLSVATAAALTKLRPLCHYPTLAASAGFNHTCASAVNSPHRGTHSHPHAPTASHPHTSAHTHAHRHAPPAVPILTLRGREIRIEIQGATLAGISVGDESSRHKVLALHGWMDNAATHVYTAQALADRGFHVVALDLPGHGRSSHRSLADSYTAAAYAVAAMEAVTKLGWTTFGLCSHSMGAGVSALVAGALGDRITFCALLEGIGLNSKDEGLGPSALRAAVDSRAKFASDARQRSYSSREDAAAARVKTTRRYPGNQSISFEGARALVERGTEPADDGGFRFCHDRRLMEASPTYLSETQMRAFLTAIRAPSLCITGTSGWPWAAGLMLGRICGLPYLEHHHLLGGHHIHIDPDTAPYVVKILLDFLDRHAAGINAHIEAHDSVSPSTRTAKSAAATPFPPEVMTAMETRSKADENFPRMDNTAAALSNILPPPAADWHASDAQHAHRAAGVAAPPLWTDRHVFTGITQPVSKTDVHAVTHSSDGQHRVHVLNNVIAPIRVAPSYSALVPPQAHSIRHPHRDELTWADLPSSVCGVSVRDFHRWGFNNHRLGVWAPRVFLETMPTLEAALASMGAK